MSRAIVVLATDMDRIRAIEWVKRAKVNSRVEFMGPKRSISQNSRLWAMITEVATQLDWHGQRLSTGDWKLLFMAALNKELRFIPNIDGKGFVNLGQSSSDLSKEEMADLITLIECFGANHGVVFHDGEKGNGNA